RNSIKAAERTEKTRLFSYATKGLVPEGGVFLGVTFPENSSLIQNFTATLTDAAADKERAKKMYLDTLAPGTIKSIVDARQLYLAWHKEA
ncbi:unnamed protein product, partial [Porites evermanni]